MIKDSVIYHEKVVSKKTEFLFLALTMLFLLLSIWRITAASLDILASVLLAFFVFFLFYSINYRTLVIRLTPESLWLGFGVFTWTIPIHNIGSIQPDRDLPVLVKYGGAGIHFMSFRNRYRVSFNFLEHPRVVIGLKRKAGLVRDVSFTTCQPDEIIQLIQSGTSAIHNANSRRSSER